MTKLHPVSQAIRERNRFESGMPPKVSEAGLIE
jgi:hypothetical protein